MTDTVLNPETEAEIALVEATPVAENVAAPADAAVATREAAAPARDSRGGARGDGRRPGGRPQRSRERAPRERSEFDQVTLDVRRVARVMGGGRRFSFSVTVVIGDKKGRVGVGLGKGADTALAIDKAVRAHHRSTYEQSLYRTRRICKVLIING
jgi:small subunit ribosomal protein S5